MIIAVLRTVILYIFVVLVLRLMGKRQIGELEASELVVTIMISEIAAMPITDLGVPLLGGVLTILVLFVLEILCSQLAYQSLSVRTFLYGKPSTLFQKGKLNQKEMKRQRFNVADLMEEIRGNGAVSLSQVEYIIMETNGRISVILNTENSPVTTKDLNLEPKPAPVHMSYVIVDNGTLVKNNMKRLGLNKAWLEKQMEVHKVKRIQDIFYLSFEQDTGQVVFFPKDSERSRGGGKG